MLHRVKYLELHVAHTCNLSCEACGHYSQHHAGGVVSLAEAFNWSKKWNDRIDPETLGLLGGEPTLHPDLCEFVRTMKISWPRAQLVIKTNGFFLYRHPNLRKTLFETGTELEINCHSEAPDYLLHYKKILEHIWNWSDIKITLKNSTDSEKARPWTRKYFGFGTTLQPFNDQNPRHSWELCHAKRCLTLFEGRLWKCPPIAYLKIVSKNYPLNSNWTPYLNYSGLTSNCTSEELSFFLKQEEEPICGMCPAREIRVEKGNPLHVQKSNWEKEKR
ncbi:MAG: radical SAM protein [Proteobacteria bacterium]|nr:radical SAM protein [Pseudomonadota bacterium]